MSKACLVDTTKCIGCRACQVACKQWNQLPAEKTILRGARGYENPSALSAKTYTRITFHEILRADGNLERSVFVKRQCMHCSDPACVSACPVAALEKVRNAGGHSAGPVVYYGEKCMGCRYCMMACPFGVPTLQWDRLAPYIQKCTFCADRQEATPAGHPEVNGEPLRQGSRKRFQESGRTPACALACPTEAIKFGRREELIQEARQRIETHNGSPGNSWKYQPCIYGEREVGGTAWLYISNVPFKKLGFRTDLGERAYSEYTRLALKAVPAAVIGVGAASGGICRLSQRGGSESATGRRGEKATTPTPTDARPRPLAPSPPHPLTPSPPHPLTASPPHLLTPATMVLLLTMAAGAVAAFLRFSNGLGATTNLSDRYPWGLWVAVDVMSGVALAAGGFTTAALVYVFGGQRYHALVRPAVLTGLLGYLFVGIGLLVDLARPWAIIHPIWMWPEHSALFEVAWCVMLYLAVLGLEFAPPVCERFGWTRLERLWQMLSPIFCVAALAFFVGAMSLSWYWAIGTGIFFGLLAIGLSSRGKANRQPGMPLLLIITGVVFSTMHQSSLGALFLLAKHSLHPLWWTPSLPINFLLSAVAVGFAIVIFEATLSAKAFRRPIEKQLLSGLGRVLAAWLWIYLGFRMIDLAARAFHDSGNLAAAFRPGPGEGFFLMLFLAEIILGVVLPATMLISPSVRRNTWRLFLTATLVVLGVVFNRINVAWLAMTVPGEGTYFPRLLEIVITVSIVAAIVFFFSITVKLFPVFVRPEQQSPA